MTTTSVFRTMSLVSATLIISACTNVDTTGVMTESTKKPIGPETAAVIVTEYGDFQCPACKYAHKEVTTPLLKKYEGKIRLEFKQFPLRSIHPYALPAAVASECAADQGKFWEFFNLAYEEQDSLSKSPYAEWGEKLGLNVDLFSRCIASEIKEDIVLADMKEGNEKGVNSTPSYYVNGELIRPNSLENLSNAIDKALEKASTTKL